jgi:autophagy-related protein 17
MHLNALEIHAQEMASLLESLVQHFDLCVNAIRHTEGGYAAVRKAASSQPPGADQVSVSGVMNPDNDQTAEEPISDEERTEMLDVLEKDAAQVDDVVLELRELLGEMETKSELITEHLSALTTTHEETVTAYHILEGVGQRLSGYVISSQDFCLRWEDTKLTIQSQLDDLEGIRVFYENYYSSYDGLILEVYRRKQCEEKIKTVMRKAMEQIEKVYEIDMKEREGFKLDVGDYLPVDLWPGVNVSAPKWEFVRKEGEAADLPELERVVVEAAGRRDRDRQRIEK